MNNSAVIEEAYEERDRFVNGRKPNNNASFISNVTFDPVLLSQISSEQEHIDWIWEGFLARGHVSLLYALSKAGKSTLISQILLNIQNGSGLAGRKTNQSKVLILSEESKGIWVRRREELGLSLDTWIISRPVRQRLKEHEWVELIKKTAQFCKQEGIGLVIVDTVSAFWGVQDENDAVKMQNGLLPINYLQEENVSVLLVHHFKKSGGDEGTASRGSGVLGATADILIELRRLQEDSNSTKRKIKTFSRFEESPIEVVIELVDGKYESLGTNNEYTKNEKNKYLLSVLPIKPDGLTIKQIYDEWESDEEKTGKTPTERSIQNYISDLLLSGAVEIVGTVLQGKSKTNLYGKSIPAADSEVLIVSNNEINVRNERPISMKDINDNKQCYACKGTEFRIRPEGGLVCSRCHPSPLDLEVEKETENDPNARS